jgi:2-polyprenyl-3-methyl-5-hydroxy-6-metoxy-1,4-benzoquinol methylase
LQSHATIPAVDAVAATDPRPCPLCAGAQRAVLFRRGPWEIVQCSDCGMVFLGSELEYSVQAQDHDWVDEWEKEVAQRKQKQPVWLCLSHLTQPLRTNTHHRLLSQTLRWKREGKLLDFGCGDSSFLVRAAKYFDVMGIELSPRSVAISRERIAAEKILEGPVTQIANGALPAGTFDVVTQFGYIEHEWQPLAGLQAAHRVLKPGGITVIKTPNYASWNRHVRGLNWCGYHIPAHCNYFTPETITALLRKAAFEPLPRPLSDRLPTSDSLWMAARKLG